MTCMQWRKSQCQSIWLADTIAHRNDLTCKWLADAASLTCKWLTDMQTTCNSWSWWQSHWLVTHNDNHTDLQIARSTTLNETTALMKVTMSTAAFSHLFSLWSCHETSDCPKRQSYGAQRPLAPPMSSQAHDSGGRWPPNCNMVIWQCTQCISHDFKPHTDRRLCFIWTPYTF